MSNQRVNIDDLAKEIATGLTEYDQQLADDVKKIVDDVAKEGVAQLKATSPTLTGSYRKGWTKTQSYSDKRTKRNTVHNRTDYQLTHLLEYGHASRYGGRVRAIEHIRPVEQSMTRELEARIERAAGGV